jgi:hypothetical protein
MLWNNPDSRTRLRDGDRLATDWLVEVVAKAIGSNDKKDVQFLAISFVDTRLPYAYFELTLDTVDVRYANRGTFLSWVTAVNRETNACPIAFQDDGWCGIFATPDFGHAKVFAVPLGGGTTPSESPRSRGYSQCLRSRRLPLFGVRNDSAKLVTVPVTYFAERAQL